MQRGRSPSRGKSPSRNRSPSHVPSDIALDVVKDTINNFISAYEGIIVATSYEEQRRTYMRKKKKLEDDLKEITRTQSISPAQRRDAHELVSAMTQLVNALDENDKFKTSRALQDIRILQAKIAQML